MANKNLNQAKNAKKDEFYTQLVDIENELKHYKAHFKGKTVLCNCDDPRVSNFFHYFSYNFEQLGLKKLITTCYKNQNRDLFSQNDAEQAIWLEYYGDRNGNRVPDPEEIGIHYFKGDGDFRSQECIELLKEADIVVTNPPFSLFREFFAWIVSANKRFLMIGNINAITYKEIFPYVRDGKVWLGATGFMTDMVFGVPKGTVVKASDKAKAERLGFKGDYTRLGNSCWFTNLDHGRRHKPLELMTMEDSIRYSKHKQIAGHGYARYDNYNAIEIPFIDAIPSDYNETMGVPITFLDKHCLEQFEIVGATESEGRGFSEGLWHEESGITQPLINGNRIYKRIFIRKKQK